MDDITHALGCLDFLSNEAKNQYEYDTESESHHDIDDNANVIRNLIDRARRMSSLLQRRNNDSDYCIACGCHNEYETHKVDCIIFPAENN